MAVAKIVNDSPERRKQDQELQDKLEQEKKEKDKIQNELVAREEALAAEQDSKKKLEDYLKDLETKLVTGGDALAQKDREQAEK